MIWNPPNLAIETMLQRLSSFPPSCPIVGRFQTLSSETFETYEQTFVKKKKKELFYRRKILKDLSFTHNTKKNPLIIFPNKIKIAQLVPHLSSDHPVHSNPCRLQLTDYSNLYKTVWHKPNVSTCSPLLLLPQRIIIPSSGSFVLFMKASWLGLVIKALKGMTCLVIFVICEEDIYSWHFINNICKNAEHH
ncbi:hypothetical protein WN51_12436 [Melipona quadrifasciata]|uniref:Uncharacterized protein n=1 Tax=Melipona quadrifasciata TaxID=166423 RepID=A0A0M9A404_9HYME|nr:hypothetical protein WN51_12436 [Melipona quadrifasciata]